MKWNEKTQILDIPLQNKCLIHSCCHGFFTIMNPTQQFLIPDNHASQALPVATHETRWAVLPGSWQGCSPWSFKNVTVQVILGGFPFQYTKKTIFFIAKCVEVYYHPPKVTSIWTSFCPLRPIHCTSLMFNIAPVKNWFGWKTTFLLGW